jgi:hypothetical protein
MSETVTIGDIVIDIQFQQRQEKFSHATVYRYADLMLDGTEFPPITLYRLDDGRLILVDGFQRLHAAKHNESTEIQADILEGTERDAILYSAGANATHGLLTSKEDKRKAATLLILDEEWTEWSDRKIAMHVGVSNKLVSSVRRELELGGDIKERTEIKVVRNGQTYSTPVSRRHGTPESRMVTRLIERVGSANKLVALLVSEYGATVSGNTSGDES